MVQLFSIKRENKTFFVDDNDSDILLDDDYYPLIV